MRVFENGEILAFYFQGPPGMTHHIHRFVSQKDIMQLECEMSMKGAAHTCGVHDVYVLLEPRVPEETYTTHISCRALLFAAFVMQL